MIVLLYISYQMQSSVSVNRILVRMVEHVGNMLSATCVSVCQVSMVPCVSLVSKKSVAMMLGVGTMLAPSRLHQLSRDLEFVVYYMYAHHH